MTSLDRVRHYVQQVQARIRWFTLSRGVAFTVTSALLLTVILAFIGNRFAFADSTVTPLRLILFLTIAAALCFGIILPLRAWNRKRTIRTIEQQVPELKERLLTLVERSHDANPFNEIIAEETLTATRLNQPERFARIGVVAGLSCSAIAFTLVLFWLVKAGPGYLGYGASLLWTGSPPQGAKPLYEISVQPGNASVRRKADASIRAQLKGFTSSRVSLFVRHQGASKWDEIAMQPQTNNSGYEFLLSSVTDPLDYYIAADSVRSQQYALNVKELPNVKRIKVQYHYPSWLNQKDAVEDPGGDVRAVEGTQAQLSIETDRKLNRGVLVLDDGSQVPLQEKDQNWSVTSLPLKKDGSYHVAAIDDGKPVRISDDYFIEAKPNEAPSVKIIQPGRDPRISPIEELTIRVQGSDDFALKNLDLHYSVNGGPEKSMRLLRSPGAKESEGKAVLALEDHKLVPGDIVSFYATASDALKNSKSDIFFAEIQPFLRNYSQSQQSGGGGGAGNSQEQISQRQKEIIAATWNEIKDDSRKAADVAEEARFLSDTQRKLAEQTQILAQRMRNRQLVDANQEFEGYVKNMEQATTAMSDAVEHLKTKRWREALTPEQKALQALMRAESMFRDIQVAFGQQNKGGGGSGDMGRDLANMQDLELDTKKNQYETGQQTASADKQSQELQTAMDKLKALAQRQQELAAQAKQQEAFRQRWEQEILRREAEQLQRQIEQLKNQANSQQQASSSSSGSRSASQSSQAESQAMESALQQLRQAQEEMRQAQRNPSGNSQRQAADRLNRATNQLSGLTQQQASQDLSQMREKAGEMAQQQRELTNRMASSLSSDSNERRPASIPRRGQWPGTLQQSRQPTGKEEELAQQNEKMARELKNLEAQMQARARDLNATKPEAASRLREALSEMQGDELGLRMRKYAEWIRQGQTSMVWLGENHVTQQLDRLHEQLKQAENSWKQENGKSAAQSDSANEATLRRNLAELRQLRESLQRQSAAQNGSRGQRRATEQATRRLAQLGQRLSGVGDLQQAANDLLSRIQPFYGPHSPDELAGRLDRELLPGIATLEIALRQKLGQKDTARGLASPVVPEEYRESVAEYFRRLSNGK